MRSPRQPHPTQSHTWFPRSGYATGGGPAVPPVVGRPAGQCHHSRHPGHGHRRRLRPARRRRSALRTFSALCQVETSRSCHTVGMASTNRRWLDRSQPQTLYMASVLLYINAVFLLLALLVYGIGGLGILGLVLLFGQVGAAWGIANEKRLGYYLGVA